MWLSSAWSGRHFSTTGRRALVSDESGDLGAHSVSTTQDASDLAVVEPRAQRGVQAVDASTFESCPTGLRRCGSKGKATPAPARNVRPVDEYEVPASVVKHVVHVSVRIADQVVEHGHSRELAVPLALDRVRRSVGSFESTTFSTHKTMAPRTPLNSLSTVGATISSFRSLSSS